jgi:hypothetical protein
MPIDPEHPAPRAKFHAWLSDGRDPSKVEQLIEDMHAVSGSAFDELCSFASKLAATEDPKGACNAARVEIEKRPTKPAALKVRT